METDSVAVISKTRLMKFLENKLATGVTITPPPTEREIKEHLADRLWTEHNIRADVDSITYIPQEDNPSLVDVHFNYADGRTTVNRLGDR